MTGGRRCPGVLLGTARTMGDVTGSQEHTTPLSLVYVSSCFEEDNGENGRDWHCRMRYSTRAVVLLPDSAAIDSFVCTSDQSY